MQLAAPAKALLDPRAGCAVPSHCQLPSRGTSVLQNGSDAIDWGAQCATIFGQNDEQTRRSAELPQPLAKKDERKVAASPSLQPRGGRDAGPRVQWQGDSGRRRRQDGPLGGTQAAADADVRLWRRVHAQGLRLPSPTQAQARCRIGPACAWCQRGGGTAIRRRRALPKELLHGGVRRAGRSVLGEGREGRAARGTGASRRQ